MCMNLSNWQITRKKTKDGLLYGYKVVYVGNGSIHYCHDWKIGTNKSNRANKDLSSFESLAGIIDYGFHICHTLNTARIFLGKSDDLKIIKVYYRPEDVVATGYFHDKKLKNVVATKVIVKSLKGV